jgi:hypothetical protein
VPRYAAPRTALLYLSLAAAGHLLWEATQLPLYTISRDGTRRDIAVALFHCTAGDALITAVALMLAILAARFLRWPIFGGRMVLAAVLLGLGYTVFSEWLNVRIRQSWSYTEAMPLLPPLATGLAPFLQWLAVPGLAFAITASRCLRGRRLAR